jgi:TonB family protein
MLSLAAAVMLQAAGAAAPQPSMIKGLDWLRRPSGADIARAYPDSAVRDERQGRATMQCTVKRDGSLEGCVVLYEDPPGYKFGEAALSLASKFQMQTTFPDGQSAEGGTVRIPLRFFLPENSGALDNFSIASRCFGATSVEADRRPTNEEAGMASGFYRSLVESAAGQMRMEADALQSTLEAARSMALNAGSQASPGLKTCLTIYRRQMSRTMTAPN